MRWLRAIRTGVVLLAVGGLLSGCEQATKPTAAAPDPKGTAAPPAAGTAPAPAQGAVRRGIDRQSAKVHFNQLGLFYFQYQTEMGRPPANWQEFGPYIKRDAGAIYQALQEGRYGMVWQANPTANTVLAYEQVADTDGSRLVLLGDRSVRILTAQEFQQAVPARGR